MVAAVAAEEESNKRSELNLNDSENVLPVAIGENESLLYMSNKYYSYTECLKSLRFKAKVVHGWGVNFAEVFNFLE